MQGVVKFFKADKGRGAIMCPELPTDVWVHFSVIDGSGFREFSAGDVVNFDVEEAEQDSFHFRATRAAFIRHGTALEVRRVDGQVVVVEPGTPHTPLLPRRRKDTSRDTDPT
ncbi:cold shock domain-containing protein [Amnibacterium kyonggiense]